MSGRPPPDPLFILRGSESPLTYLHLPSTSSDILYSGNQDGHVLVWNLKSRRVIRTIDAHPKSPILWLQTTNNQYLFTQGRDGQVKLWRYEENKWIEKGCFRCASEIFCAGCLFSYNECSYVVIPSPKQSAVDIVRFNMEQVETTQSLSTLNTAQLAQVETTCSPANDKYGMCMCLKYAGTSQTDNKPMILVAYENGMVVLWDAFSAKILDILQLYNDSIMCLDFSETSSKGICGSVSNLLETFKIENEKLVKDQTIEVVNDGFASISIRGDNKLVVTTGWDGIIRLFSLKTWKPLAILKYHKESVQCSDFTSDNILMCGSKDKLISVWKIY